MKRKKLKRHRLRFEALEFRRVLTTSLDLATLLPENGGDGSRGFVFLGKSANDLAEAGDVDGDGFADVLVASFSNDQIFVIRGGPTGSTVQIQDQDLRDGSGYVFSSNSSYDEIGLAVHGNLDINADGELDFVFSASHYDNVDFLVGYHSVLGPASEWDSSNEVWQYEGPEPPRPKYGHASSHFATDRVVTADINGDGFDDIITSTALTWNIERVGQVNVALGSATGLGDRFTIQGSILPNIPRNIDWRIGSTFDAIGDINNDGFDDLFVGGDVELGGVIIFGRANWMADHVYEVKDFVNDETRVQFAENDRTYSRQVSGLGDINGDEIDDFVIGVSQGDGPTENRADTGEAYVVFGQTNFSVPDFDQLNGSNGFTIYGVDHFDHLGYSVDGGGDFNGDGLNDIILGAPFADGPSDTGPGSRESAGDAYVLYGKNDWSNGFHYQLGFMASDAGLVLHGSQNKGQLGQAIEFVGDVNNDGFDDIAISAPTAKSPPCCDSEGFEQVGLTFIIYGSADGNAPPTNGLGGGSGADWYNEMQPSDVNSDGQTGPLDALLVINELSNRNFSDPRTGAIPDTDRPNGVAYYDVNDDGFVAPLDALTVINALDEEFAATGRIVPRLVADDIQSANEAETETLENQWAAIAQIFRASS